MQSRPPPSRRHDKRAQHSPTPSQPARRRMPLDKPPSISERDPFREAPGSLGSMSEPGRRRSAGRAATVISRSISARPADRRRFETRTRTTLKPVLGRQPSPSSARRGLFGGIGGLQLDAARPRRWLAAIACLARPVVIGVICRSRPAAGREDIRSAVSNDVGSTRTCFLPTTSRPQLSIGPRCETNPSCRISASHSTSTASPVAVSSIVTRSRTSPPFSARTSQGVCRTAAPSSTSCRTAVCEDSRARKRSRRCTTRIGPLAVSCRLIAQSSAESPPPTITQRLPAKSALRLTK